MLDDRICRTLRDPDTYARVTYRHPWVQDIFSDCTSQQFTMLLGIYMDLNSTRWRIQRPRSYGAGTCGYEVYNYEQGEPRFQRIVSVVDVRDLPRLKAYADGQTGPFLVNKKVLAETLPGLRTSSRRLHHLVTALPLIYPGYVVREAGTTRYRDPSNEYKSYIVYRERA